MTETPFYGYTETLCSCEAHDNTYCGSHHSLECMRYDDYRYEMPSAPFFDYRP